MNGTPHDPTRLSPDAREALADVLAAYALDALPAPEAEAVTRHLAVCPTCRAEAGELAATAALLPATCEPVDPSPALRVRLLAAVRGAPDGVSQPPIRVLPTPPADVAVAPPPPRRGGAVWRPWLLLAAAVLLTVGVGISNVVLRGELRERETQLALYQSASRSWALAGSAERQGARGSLVQPSASDTPLLVLHNLPPLPANRAYQVWVIRGGQPVSVAVLPAGAEGEQVVALSQPLADVQTVAISIEPAGGSPGPTGDIVLATNL